MLTVLLVEDNEKLAAALRVGLEGTGRARVGRHCASGERSSLWRTSWTRASISGSIKLRPARASCRSGRIICGSR